MTGKPSSSVASLALSACTTYAKGLHRYLARRLARPQDVDDLAQEIYIRMLRVNNSESVRNPQAYLYGVAFHVVREFRLRRAHESEFIDFDTEAVDERSRELTNDSPDHVAEQLNLQRQLEQAFQTLSPAHQAVLLLIKRDGLSYEEAARATQLSIHTVERYLFEALARMRTTPWDR